MVTLRGPDGGAALLGARQEQEAGVREGPAKRVGDRLDAGQKRPPQGRAVLTRRCGLPAKHGPRASVCPLSKAAAVLALRVLDEETEAQRSYVTFQAVTQLTSDRREGRRGPCSAEGPRFSSESAFESA